MARGIGSARSCPELRATTAAPHHRHRTIDTAAITIQIRHDIKT
jgi:hypothetical protein